MSERFDRFFADLEAQEAARLSHERMAELPERVVEEFADADLVTRLCGALGTRIVCRVLGEAVAGVLRQVGSDWVRVDSEGEVLIGLRHLQRVRLSTLVHVDPGMTLSMRSPLRQLARERTQVSMVLSDGEAVDGSIEAVARDYASLRSGDGRDVVRLEHIALVISRQG